MAKGPNSVLIRLVSTAINPATGKKTGYTYVTRKNQKLKPEKMLLRKYDPVVRQHVEFKEEKIK